ncbi:hypothetical protein B0H34DRAFT_643992, partial [Crassisporium funariophilum]
VDALNGCLCGDIVDPSSSAGVIKCRQLGCETQWYHLGCVSLEIAPWSWLCNACEGMGSAQGNDVILPCMDACLIT